VAATGLLVSIVGAVIALVGTYYLGLRDRFGGRRGAFQVLEQDLSDTSKRIQKALDSDELWPAGQHLTSREWIVQRQMLASHMRERTWREFQHIQEGLDAADRRAKELRAENKHGPDDQLRKDLKALQVTIGSRDDGKKDTGPSDGTKKDTALKKLARGMTGARVAPALALALGLVILAVGLFLLWPKTPTWTTASLDRAFEAGTPHAQLAVCDSSTSLDGADTCMARYKECALVIATDDKGPTCSPPLTVTFSVLTGEKCYLATPSNIVAGNDPDGALFERIRMIFEKLGTCRI
jgi:hypothetical protein